MDVVFAVVERAVPGILMYSESEVAAIAIEVRRGDFDGEINHGLHHKHPEQACAL